MNRNKSTATLLFTIFIVNFLSLIYQVIWVRKLMVSYGSTALSVSTVLTVFLSGIAAGGYLGSLWIQRVKNKHSFLGWLLIALGGYCLTSIYLLGFIKYPFFFLAGTVDNQIAINLIKLLFSFIILIFPTTIIGAMFPIITYLYSTEFKRFGRDVASVYLIDTLGASAGALVCGFLLVPYVGLQTSSFFSALMYLLLGLFFIKKARNKGEAYIVEKVDPTDTQKDPINKRLAEKTTGFNMTNILVLSALFISGFSALVLEVTWSRFFHLLFGTSIYAFSLVIAAFLLGLSMGSFFIKRIIDKLKQPLLLFAFIYILIAGFSLLVLQSSSLIESYYYRFFYSTNNFYVFHGLIFAIAFFLMLIPTSLMGANFPLAVKIISRSWNKRSVDAGLAFAINTSGGIVGAFAAGFLVIPFLGLEKTGFLASGIYFFVGFVFLLYSTKRILPYVLAVSISVALLSISYLSGGMPVLNQGVYYDGVRNASISEFWDYKDRSKMLYSKHGYYGLVTVSYDPVSRLTSLFHNGKADASTNKAEMSTQLMIAYLPLFFHNDPENVLNIGLGGGFTLGAITSHPIVKSIDMVEIDPLVFEAAQKHFSKFNNNALSDSRVNKYIQDGRHFLGTTKDKYDVIISEPPNLWVSGVSQLFTKEFYRTAAKHLKDDGILAQWVPLYELDTNDLKLILNTIKGSFEYVSYWSNSADVVILASNKVPQLDVSYINDLMEVQPVVANLQRIMPEVKPKSMINFLRNPEVGFEAMDNFLRGVKEINSDDLPLLEFKTARNMFNNAHNAK